MLCEFYSADASSVCLFEESVYRRALLHRYRHILARDVGNTDPIQHRLDFRRRFPVTDFFDRLGLFAGRSIARLSRFLGEDYVAAASCCRVVVVLRRRRFLVFSTLGGGGGARVTALDQMSLVGLSRFSGCRRGRTTAASLRRRRQRRRRRRCGVVGVVAPRPLLSSAYR